MTTAERYPYMEGNAEISEKLDALSEKSSDLCHDAFLLMGHCMADFAWWSEKEQKDASFLEDAERRILIVQDYAKKVLANIHEIRRELCKEKQCAVDVT